MDPTNLVLIKRYLQMLAKDPKSKVFCPLAQLYRIENDLKTAEKTCLDGLKHNPKYVIGYILLAKIYLDRKKYDRALETIQQAEKISPDNSQIYKVLARIYTEKKDMKKTLAAYKMLHFLKPWDDKVVKNIQHLEKINNLNTDQNDKTPVQINFDDNTPKTQKILKLKKMLSIVDRHISEQTLRES